MNDRFKFRMYDTNVNKMYMPNDYEEVESIYECIKQQINWDLDVDYDIKFNHLEDGRFFMQCTGLKDKNGKLIYEGDIIKICCCNLRKTQISDVFFCQERSAFCFHYKTDYGDYANCTMEKTIIEVIGNIYENKELLESEEQ